eukprot:Skav208652  [mRNA]  locus=scaffold3489:80380:92366:+ [translate_table: standard]
MGAIRRWFWFAAETLIKAFMLVSRHDYDLGPGQPVHLAPFVACGGRDTLDADTNYPVASRHEVLQPVAPPIDAPYMEALEERRAPARPWKAWLNKFFVSPSADGIAAVFGSRRVNLAIRFLRRGDGVMVSPQRFMAATLLFGIGAVAGEAPVTTMMRRATSRLEQSPWVSDAPPALLQLGSGIRRCGRRRTALVLMVPAIINQLFDRLNFS